MLELIDVCKTFNLGKTNETPVLQGVSLSFPSKGLFIILGPSGSGKTTLLSLLGALDSPTSGQILYNGVDIAFFSEKQRNRYRQKTVSFIFQENNLIDYLTLQENASLKSEASKEEKEKVLNRLSIDKVAKKKPASLSGGEKERGAIARALLSDSSVLLCDEPTASLDSKNAENVLSLLADISKEKLVIVVSHDEVLCRKYSDNIISIRDGRVAKNEIEKEEATPSNEGRTSSTYRKGILKKGYFHAVHKIKESTLIVALSLIAFFCVCMILGVSKGGQELVDSALYDLVHYAPLTISSYYENISTIDLLNDVEIIAKEGITIDQKTSILSSLHKNIITTEFVDYLKSVQVKDSYFAINNDQAYSLIYEDNGSYRLFDEQSVNSLNDYVESFFGKKQAINELIYDEEYFRSHYNWVDGTFPKNENEAMLVYTRNHTVNEDIATLLNIKENDPLSSPLGKSIHIASHELLYEENDTLEVTGRFLKDKATLDQEGKDVRALNNYLIRFGNAYYEGDVQEQNAAMSQIDSLFNENAETRTLKAYIKTQNSTALKNLVNQKKTDDIVITGIAEVKPESPFANKINGILIPSAKLADIRHRNSLSVVAKEIDNHIVLAASSSPINIPKIYSYNNLVKDTFQDNLEEGIIAYLSFFEARKFFSVNEEISSIEIYADNATMKDYYSGKIAEYNKEIDPSYEIKPLDFSKKIIGYFGTYAGIIQTILYSVSIIVLVVSGVLSMAILFNRTANRINEIGLLRSCGYSRGYVFLLLEIESILLGLLSGALGIGLANIVAPLLNKSLAATQTQADLSNIIHISVGDSFLILGISLLVAFVASLVPSLLFARKKPLELLKR